MKSFTQIFQSHPNVQSHPGLQGALNFKDPHGANCIRRTRGLQFQARFQVILQTVGLVKQSD